MHACLFLYAIFKRHVQVGGRNPGILWNVEKSGLVSAIIGSSKFWRRLCLLPFFISMYFYCICSYWQQIVQHINDKTNKSIKDIFLTCSMWCLNGSWVCVWGRRRQEKQLSMDREWQCRGNEPWSEVKSKVEAHLLQSDGSKTNEAQRGNLEKPHYGFCANWKLAH